jgi:B-cell receptor-associated protein 31
VLIYCVKMIVKQVFIVFFNQVTDLKNKLKELEDQLATEVKDKTALKKQSDNLAKEYDRLAEEHSKLQKKITISGGDADTKKEN